MRNQNPPAKISQKESYDHFMLKEIYEQPEAIQKTVSSIKPVNLKKELYMVACGSSYYAALLSVPFFLKAGINARPIISSEFDLLLPLISESSRVLAISQSGETAETLSVVKAAKKRGAEIISITNTKDSSLVKLSDQIIYTECGSEKGIAATKTFTCQVAALISLTKKISVDKKQMARWIQKNSPKIKAAVSIINSSKTVLFVGRKEGHILALEGALKMKEVSYIHAEGIAGGELRHGPMALIDKNCLVIAITPFEEKRMLSLLKEVKKKEAKIVSICLENSKQFHPLSEAVIEIPKNLGSTKPIFTVIPLQLLAYFTGVSRGVDVDKPRNLTKSVRVE